jgi:hypothetical protein
MHALTDHRGYKLGYDLAKRRSRTGKTSAPLWLRKRRNRAAARVARASRKANR